MIYTIWKTLKVVQIQQSFMKKLKCTGFEKHKLTWLQGHLLSYIIHITNEWQDLEENLIHLQHYQAAMLPPIPKIDSIWKYDIALEKVHIPMIIFCCRASWRECKQFFYPHNLKNKIKNKSLKLSNVFFFHFQDVLIFSTPFKLFSNLPFENIYLCRKWRQIWRGKPIQLLNINYCKNVEKKLSKFVAAYCYLDFRNCFNFHIHHVHICSDLVKFTTVKLIQKYILQKHTYSRNWESS